jgi:hypothetical protein
MIGSQAQVFDFKMFIATAFYQRLELAILVCGSFEK